MTRLTLSTASPLTTKADAVVVAALQGEDGPIADNPEFAAAVAAAALAGATGKPGNVTTIPAAGLVAADRVVVVGIGKPPAGESTPDSDAALYERVRKAAGAASRAVAGHAKVISTLSAIDLTAAAEGHLLGAYVFDTYKKPGQPPVEAITLTVESAAKAAKQTLARAVITAEAVAFARSLINSAPNDLFPAEFAARASTAGLAAGLEVEVLDEKALAKAGYGGILGVGAGSTRPPRLVRLSYTPAEARRQGRAGRQGHHLRLGRPVDQAGRQDGPDDQRHVRCCSGCRDDRGGGEAGTAGRGDGLCGAGREPALRDRRTDPVTCCGTTAGSTARASRPAPARRCMC